MKILLDNGYKKFESEHNKVLRGSSILFQKKVEDSIGIRYFINCWIYFRDGRDVPFFESQMYNEKDVVEMDVSFFTEDYQEVESKLDNIWHKLELGYYEK